MFALKTFVKSRTIGLETKLFTQEIVANLKAPVHERIVPLLAAYKHWGSPCLIFPWANGGDLQDVWRNYAPAGRGGAKIATWYSERWLLGECFGIVDALANVHRLIGINNSGSQAQIHTDIKPDNVLCFKSYNDGLESLVLKLADFGEAKSVGPGEDSTVEARWVAHAKTYRPPEHSNDGHISRNYDVWCLGCLFLEFITWALQGWRGMEEFTIARLEEQEAPEVSGVQGQVQEDTFFKRTTQKRGGLRPPSVEMGYKSEKQIQKGRVTTKRIFWFGSHVRISNKVKDAVVSVGLVSSHYESQARAVLTS